MLIMAVTGAKKKIIIGLVLALLLVVGLWLNPWFTHEQLSDKPTMTTVGEKGAPPLLERVVNRLRVYYRYH